MNTEHVKVFSGSSIIVRGLQNLLDKHKIRYIIKDNVESARLAGFGEQMNAIDVFVLNIDKEKAVNIANSYRNEINS